MHAMPIHSCAADLEIEVLFGENPESLKELEGLESGVGQNMVLYALLTARNSAFLNLTFRVHSAAFTSVSVSLSVCLSISKKKLDISSNIK